MGRNCAYVGKAVPVGWDYAREDTVGIPNPVLESVLGLLLCYDEIWFPSREFCPEDMRDLSYIKFIDEMSTEKDRALEAVMQAQTSELVQTLRRDLQRLRGRYALRRVRQGRVDLRV